MIYRNTIVLLLIIWSLLDCRLVSASNDKGDDGYFYNLAQLETVFEKLLQLEQNKSGKLNIVHIGDSHIQADMLTDAIRQILQSRFGNGGYGFTFPYSLAKTNGAGYVKYKSDAVWNSRRNIYPVTDVSIGLSGIGLYTNNPNLRIRVEADPLYAFNSVKVLSTTTEPGFEVSFSEEKFIPKENNSREEVVLSTKVERDNPMVKAHIVQRGETLYRIALNNNTSVDRLKELNGLQSNVIKTGMTIILPDDNKAEAVLEEPHPEEIKVIEQPAPKKQKEAGVLSGMYFTETKDTILTNIAFIDSKDKRSEYNLSGIVLENDKPGVVYHSIGVNGAKVSDYNKYPLFFKQLPVLNPDLVIISLGTNESFGKWSAPYYMDQLRQLVQNIKNTNPNAVILVTTPPPSLFRRKNPNEFIEGYREAMVQSKEYVVWDLLSRLGGINAPKGKALSDMMARDKVHYTKDGYEEQGRLFATDFLTAYDRYVKNRRVH